MIIAIPTDDKSVAQHFGRCEKYTLFTVEDNKLIDVKEINNPGHEPGFLPKFLYQQGVSCIIASGMGQKAQDLFMQYHIDMILGAEGHISNIIKMYLTKKLKSGESTCNHDSEHECKE